jgi:hypothetical protein
LCCAVFLIIGASMTNSSECLHTHSSASAVPRRGDLLDRQGVALYANVTPRMASRILNERRVPTVKIGRYVRVWSDDLDAWLTANTRPAVSK